MSQAGLKEYLESLPKNEILTIESLVPRDELLSSLVMELETEGRTPIVMLKRVENTKYPIVANLFASRDRIARMVGATTENLYLKWRDAQNNMMAPILVNKGPVQDNIICLNTDIDMQQLPISVHFSTDAGRYISSGIVVAKDPDTSVYNLSYHRMQLKSRDHFGISLHSRGHLWDYFRRSKEKGQNLEIAVIIGAHPSLYLAASSKMSIDADEYALAGGLIGASLELVKCATVDLAVPANAEIILEGIILANQFEDEGPFGEYTGYSTSRSTRNVFQVTGMMHRNDPIFMEIIPGFSSEHLLLGSVGKECENFAILKDKFPTIVDVNLPKSGTHFHAYMKLKKTVEGQPRQAMMLLAGLDPYLKTIIAVDEDINIYDEEHVLWAMATRMQPHQDVLVVPDMMCNVLDPSSKNGISSKLFIDATQALDSSISLCQVDEHVRTLARQILGIE